MPKRVRFDYEHFYVVARATRSRIRGREFRVGQALLASSPPGKEYVDITVDGRADQIKTTDLEYVGTDLESLTLGDLKG